MTPEGLPPRLHFPIPAYSWTENYALEHGRSPEEILLEREERAPTLLSPSCRPPFRRPWPIHPHTGPAASEPTTLPVSASRKSPPEGGRRQQQGQRCHPAGPAEYAPLL